MVLDDDPFVTDLVSRELRNASYRIRVANDVDAAFELLTCHQVGVVLSDQSMPKLTGTEFLGRVKQLYPQTVRLLFSAYRNFELATAAINLGAVHHFLTKPWNPNELNQLIAQAFTTHARMAWRSPACSNELALSLCRKAPTS
ncbi:response regulator [Pseudogulbenkiania sp. NH8B]|uniref:response regulator n=1 Tax=Pseudogulbenkiania sp. (strain NH8B) TaxID=748280 RepID=UPI00350F1CBE